MWIKLTDTQDQPIMVNMDRIMSFKTAGHVVTMTRPDGHAFDVKETFETVKAKLELET
jgi:hypothetical protein